MGATEVADVDPLLEAAREQGLPPHELEIIARRSAGRSCGACTACCQVRAVRELGKPSQTRCQHLCAAGCAIYDRRPKSCRDYACLWRQGFIQGDERRRPDKLGVIIDYEPFAPMPGKVRLIVWEVVPGAAQTAAVAYVVDKLLRAHPEIKAVAYCAAGRAAHHDFTVDRQAYPGDDLPAALPIVGFDRARGVTTYDFRNAG